MKIDTKAIRERYRYATPPPWSIEVDGVNGLLYVVCDHNTKPWNYTDVASDHDCAFINAARADVPKLCDRVEELEAFVRQVREWCEGAGTGQPTGDELNICAQLFGEAGITLEEA